MLCTLQTCRIYMYHLYCNCTTIISITLKSNIYEHLTDYSLINLFNNLYELVNETVIRVITVILNARH